MAKIVAVANQKGGVGKTTTAVNLSSCVAALGKKVLIVDLDPQGNTTTGYGISKRSVDIGTYEILIGEADARQAVRKTEFRTDVIGSNTRLAGASLEMIDLPGRESRLRKALASIQQDYDFIFIDCPPSLDLLTLNGLCACDSILIPVQCEYYALEGLSELVSTLKTVRKKYNAYLDIEGVVFTMFAVRYNLTLQVVEQVKKYFGNKVYQTTIPRSIRVSEAPSFESDTRIETLPLREIEPDPGQPRKTFDDETLAELSASIAEHGLLQPIAVRPRASGGYLIVAGERRWRASRMAGLTEVPVIVKDVTDEQAMELALVENLQREDLDPVEEAAGIRELMDRCGLTQEQAARKLGKSRSALANILRLLTLPESVLELLKSGFITIGHAKVVLGLPTPELQAEAAQMIADNQLNVRQAEALCKKLAKPAKEPAAPPLPSALPVEVEESLKQALGSEVRVAYHDGKGKLTVHFYSDDQLKAFANLLGQYSVE